MLSFWSGLPAEVGSSFTFLCKHEPTQTQLTFQSNGT